MPHGNQQQTVLCRTWRSPHRENAMSMTADYSYLTALKIVHSMNCSMSASGQKQTQMKCQLRAKNGHSRFYSITSSAKEINPEGMFTPIALAVFKLTTNSYFVGCTIGSSPGFAPLRICPV